MNMSIVLMLVMVSLALLGLVLLYRVFKGPHVIDRVIAADCIDVILGLIMIGFGCYQDRGLYVDLGLIITLLGFIGSILISKYVEGELW